jgi:integrase
MGMKRIGADSWRLDVRVWVAGKENRTRETFNGGAKAAQARYHEIKKTLRAQGSFSALGASSTFSEVISPYLRLHKVGSEYYLARLKAELGAVPLRELAARFDRWLSLMRDTKTKDGTVTTPATCNRYLAWAKAALNFARQRGLYAGENPLRGFRKEKEVPRDLPFSEIDERNLLNAIDESAPELSALVRFALAVPVRISEALAMRRADVDLFNGCIRSRQGTMKGGRMAAIKPIPPDPVVLRHLRTLPADCDAVWYRRVGRRNVGIRSFVGAWRACVKAAKLPGWRFHDLRHVAVTRLLNAGTPAQVVAQVAGWTSTAMIRQYYKLEGQSALKLVRFTPPEMPKTGHLTGHLAETPEIARAATA